MCGFTGFLAGDLAFGEKAKEVLRPMAAAIAHRGPDSQGIWCDGEAGVALAHNRLAIVDLSKAGSQPMISQSGRYVIAYNGEVYNHLAIRAEIRDAGFDVRWRGHSDTETLLAAIELWGLKATLKRAIGMFALVLWDRSTRTLSLARDRVGEKPLYYGWQGSGNERTFLFGSELKALRRHPAFEGEPDRGAAAAFMRLGYIPAPLSAYRGVSKLHPGEIATIRDGGQELQLESYWSAAEVVKEGVGDPVDWSAEESVDHLEALLLDAVGQQMLSDVPLGAFLSGGVDSSTIVALMQTRSNRPVKTFSIGFHEKDYNEADHASAVADHLGTDHTELYVTASEAREVIPDLPTIYDEPFADPSQIPTFLVSRLAREQVTVALSGDAGDELFGGYNRYAVAATMWRRLRALPAPLRRGAARTIRAIPPARLNNLSGLLGPMLQGVGGGRNLGYKVHKAAGVLASRSSDELYRGLTSIWPEPAAVVRGACEPLIPLQEQVRALEGLTDTERMMAQDLVTYLPDDILIKVDRAGMAVSLEGRVPFLDHRVVEFAWRLPGDHKIRDGVTKWVLRKVLHRYVPSELVERPKMGFGLPIGDWLRGPLEDWVESLLDERLLKEKSILEPQPVRSLWKAHKAGFVDAQYQLWNALMMQAWLVSIGAGEGSDEVRLNPAVADRSVAAETGG